VSHLKPLGKTYYVDNGAVSNFHCRTRNRQGYQQVADEIAHPCGRQSTSYIFQLSKTRHLTAV